VSKKEKKIGKESAVVKKEGTGVLPNAPHAVNAKQEKALDKKAVEAMKAVKKAEAKVRDVNQKIMTLTEKIDMLKEVIKTLKQRRTDRVKRMQDKLDKEKAALDILKDKAAGSPDNKKFQAASEKAKKAYKLSKDTLDGVNGKLGRSIKNRQEELDKALVLLKALRAEAKAAKANVDDLQKKAQEAQKRQNTFFHSKANTQSSSAAVKKAMKKLKLVKVDIDVKTEEVDTAKVKLEKAKKTYEVLAAKAVKARVDAKNTTDITVRNELLAIADKAEKDALMAKFKVDKWKRKLVVNKDNLATVVKKADKAKMAVVEVAKETDATAVEAFRDATKPGFVQEQDPGFRIPKSSSGGFYADTLPSSGFKAAGAAAEKKQDASNKAATKAQIKHYIENGFRIPKSEKGGFYASKLHKNKTGNFKIPKSSKGYASKLFKSADAAADKKLVENGFKLTKPASGGFYQHENDRNDLAEVQDYSASGDVVGLKEEELGEGAKQDASLTREELLRQVEEDRKEEEGSGWGALSRLLR